MDEMEKLLMDCSAALNEIPNKKLRANRYKDTYELAAALDKFFRELSERRQAKSQIDWKTSPEVKPIV